MTTPRVELFVTCGYCGNYAQMKELGHGADTETYTTEIGPPVEQGTYYDVLKCLKCGNINIGSYIWSDYMEMEDFTGYTMIYPQTKELPNGLPDNIYKAYTDAEKVKQIAPVAYGLLLGRILEMICQEKKAKGRTLQNWLDDLKSRGEIPDKLVKVASILRGYRNLSAHAGIDIGLNEIPLVKALCDALMEYIYGAPYLAELAEKQLLKLKGLSSK
jgi:hypothetical protein